MISENLKSNFNTELLESQRPEASQNFHFYVSTQNKLRRSLHRKNKVGCDSLYVHCTGAQRELHLLAEINSC